MYALQITNRNIWWRLSEVDERDFMLTTSPPKRSPSRLPELPKQEKKRPREEEGGNDDHVGKVKKIEESDSSSSSSSSSDDDDCFWLLLNDGKSDDSKDDEDGLNGDAGNIYLNRNGCDDDDDSDSDDGDKYDMMTLNYNAEEDE